MIGQRVDVDAHWRAFDERAEREEPPYVRAALELFATEAGLVTQIMRRAEGGDVYVIAALTRIMGDYAPGGDYHTAWLRRYTDLIGQTVRVGGEQMADRIGIDFDLSNPRVLAIVRQRTADLVKNVTDTTKEAIRAAVLAGREQGLGARDIARLIEDSTFGEITRTRAQTIARTETVGALNAGEYQSATQSGVMRSKTWVHQLVGNSRPNHKAMDGRTIDIEGAFPNGLRYPHEPGAPAREVVNCRCTLTYSDEEAPV